MDEEEVWEEAGRIADASNGVITEKQMASYILLEREGMSAKEAGDLLGVGRSTVYTNRNNASVKIEGAKSLVGELLRW